MSTIRTSFAITAIFAAALSTAVQAQPAPTAPASAAAPKQQECGKTMARHDHGAEKGTPRPSTMAMPCAAKEAASAPDASASAPKKKLKHDHSTFHKTM